MAETNGLNEPISSVTSEPQYRTVTTVTQFPESEFDNVSIDNEIVLDLTERNARIFGDYEQRQTMFTDLASYFEEVTNPANTVTNTFFKAKYAPLNEVLNTVRPILGKYGLSVVQIPTFDNANCSVNTLLTHKSGGCIFFPALQNKPTKPDVQGMGSTLTYLRRFALNAILGVMGEVDDDGNAASEKAKSDKPAMQKDTLLEAARAYVAKAEDANDKQVRNAKIIELTKKYTDDGKIASVTDGETRTRLADEIEKL
jgi:hypothetical protein